MSYQAGAQQGNLSSRTRRLLSEERWAEGIDPLLVPRRYRPAIRCTAHKKDGSSCKKYAMHGQHICASHGGRARQNREAADRRLKMAAAEAYLTGQLSYWAVHDQQRAADVRKLLGLDARGRRETARVLAEMKATAEKLEANAIALGLTTRDRRERAQDGLGESNNLGRL